MPQEPGETNFDGQMESNESESTRLWPANSKRRFECPGLSDEQIAEKITNDLVGSLVVIGDDPLAVRRGRYNGNVEEYLNLSELQRPMVDNMINALIEKMSLEFESASEDSRSKQIMNTVKKGLEIIREDQEAH